MKRHEEEERGPDFWTQAGGELGGRRGPTADREAAGAEGGQQDTGSLRAQKEPDQEISQA